MKKSLLATAAALTLSAPAMAADLGARPYYGAPPAYAAPIYNWTGFYIGGHVGGAFGGNSNFSGLVLGTTNARLMGGVQVGADWQFTPNLVVGLEGQYSWLGNNALTAVFPAGFVYNNNRNGLGSITARFGYTWGPGLVYAKGGYAFAANNETLTLGGVPIAFITDGSHQSGYTLGAGVEYMFAPNWTAKAEYQYYNLGDARFLAPAVLVPFGTFHNDEHTLKAGINYRFNFPAPVAGRY